MRSFPEIIKQELANRETYIQGLELAKERAKDAYDAAIAKLAEAQAEYEEFQGYVQALPTTIKARSIGDGRKGS